MKKSFIVLTLVVIALVGVVSSCSQTDVPEMEECVENIKPADKNYVQLRNQIMELNKENIVASRGSFRDFLKRLVCVVRADAAGGLVGAIIGPISGVVGATACSAAAAVLPLEAMEVSPQQSRCAAGDEVAYVRVNKPNEALKNTVCQIGSSPSFADSVGYYHNRILLEYYNHNTTPSEDIDSMIEGIYAEAANIFNVSLQTLYYDTCTAACLDPFFSSKLYQQDEDVSMSDYCSRLKTYYPEYSSDIDVYEQIMEGILNIEDIDESNYVDKVIAYIQASNISQFHKESLINATLIGNASAKLWKIED